jgi:hypothetical protein
VHVCLYQYYVCEHTQTRAFIHAYVHSGILTCYQHTQANVQDRDSLLQQVSQRIDEARVRAMRQPNAATGGADVAGDASKAFVRAKQRGDDIMAAATSALGRLTNCICVCVCVCVCACVHGMSLYVCAYMYSQTEGG